MAAWPLTLPVLGLVDAWDEQDDEALISFKPEKGPPRDRRGISDPGTLVAAQTPPMDVTQRGILLAFFRVDCGRGAVEFTMDHPIMGDSMVWKFSAPPQIRLVGIHFIASLQLRIMPGSA